TIVFGRLFRLLPPSPLSPSTTLFRSDHEPVDGFVTFPANIAALTVQITPTDDVLVEGDETLVLTIAPQPSTYAIGAAAGSATITDRKSTRLNSSHVKISYAVFCLKKK